jgi:hypothetical protein
MTAPGVVYRATDPAVLEAWDAWAVRRTDWGRRLHEIVESVSPYAAAETGIFTVSRPSQFAGIGYSGSYGRDAIAALKEQGWRLDRKHGVLMPHKSTAPGRAIAKKLDQIGSCPDVDLPGMPSMCFSGMSFMYPGIERKDGPPGGYLLVLWSTPTVELEKVDPAVYEQILLSEYYRIKEAETAAEATS